jgi:hypothetical protein
MIIYYEIIICFVVNVYVLDLTIEGSLQEELDVAIRDPLLRHRVFIRLGI